MPLAPLIPYCGTWEGQGVGEFPILSPERVVMATRRFRYRERLSLRHDVERGFIHMELHAWRTMFGTEVENASHHEVGAIAADGDGLVMSTIQNGTRYERLRGTVEPGTDGLGIAFVSVQYANDPRVVSSWRRWQLTSAALEYEMAIETVAMGTAMPHLHGRLTRASG